MRDYAQEPEKRVEFIKNMLAQTGTKGIVYGNSGGKDSALVGILCKKACDNVLGVMMPCQSKCNYGEDMKDGIAVAEKFNIDTVTVDLTAVKEAEMNAVSKILEPTASAQTNIAPRLRMTTLYTMAQSKNALVAGTDNKSEMHMGYFTKWGDGAYDFNPIADLTVTEVYKFLAFLEAPENIIKKAPSAGLFEGQTDEDEMGVTYAEIDKYIAGEPIDEKSKAIIERYHRVSEHKRHMPVMYKG